MLPLRHVDRSDKTTRVPIQWTIGDVVRKLRDQKGWKQADLAREAGLDVTVVSRLEKRSELSEQRTIYRVAKALGVSVADLHAYAEPVSMTALDRQNWALWKRVEREPDKARILLDLANDYDEQRRAREIQQRSEAAATLSGPADQSPPKVQHG